MSKLHINGQFALRLRDYKNKIECFRTSKTANKTFHYNVKLKRSDEKTSFAPSIH